MKRTGIYVRCSESGTCFPSAAEAAEKYGIPYTAVMQALHTGCAAHGLHFEKMKKTTDGLGRTKYR